MGRQDSQGNLLVGVREARQLRVEAGDARGLGEGEGDAEGSAQGCGAGRPDGRLGLVREGGVVVPAEDEGLQDRPAGEGSDGHRDLP